MPVDPEIAVLLGLIAGGTPMSEGTADQARAAFRTLTVDFRRPESVVPVAAVEETTVAGAERPLAARVYVPEDAGARPTVVLFHGGGWVIGDLDTHDNLARSICRRAGAYVVSVDYRLAPEHRYPAAALDAVAATRDVAARLNQFGGCDRLAVAGDSAGGNLSAVVTQTVPGLAAQLLIYPSVDVPGDYPSRKENAHGYFLDEPTMLWFAGNYLEGEVDLLDPQLSPLHGRLAGLPPAVVVTAEFDPLRDEGLAYADALRAAGVHVDAQNYPGMIHGFIDMGPWSVAAQAATDDALDRFARLLNGC